VSVTGSGLDLKDTLLDGKKRNIEGSSSQVEDENVSLAIDLLVKTVGNGSGSWLVNDSENVETGDKTGVLGGLTLRVVEVGWDGNDGVVDGSTEVGLSSLSHLHQDHGGDLFWCELLLLALEFNLHDWLSSTVEDGEREVLHVGLDLSICELATDKTLSIEDSVRRVHGDLVLCGISDQTLGVGEGNEGRSRSVALVVGNDFDSVITEDTHAGVGSSKIDTYGEAVSRSFVGSSRR